MNVARASLLFTLPLLAYACATGESLGGDDDVAPDTDAAAGPSGASGGSAPISATGGVPTAGAAGGGPVTAGGPGVGGTGGAAQTDAGADATAPVDGGFIPVGPEPCVDPGTKRCGGLCIPPTPALGCGLDDCTPCPDAPLNGFPRCDGAACGFGCAGDYVATGSTCEPVTPDGGPLPPACRDGLRNGGETDVDCGGAECGGCSDGRVCGVGADCVSQVCTGSTCATASCSDGVRNALETDVDCGGNCGATCQTGQSCSGGPDCSRGPCVSGLCTCAPVCPTGLCGASLNDGCGGQIDCSCPNGNVCFNSACCTPVAACGAGQCGAIDDGCGGTLDCSGNCPGGDVCLSNTCCSPITSCDPDQCGAVDDGCGGSFDCGGCSGGEICSGGVCCAPGACTPPEAGCVSASYDGHYYWFCSTARTWRAARDRCMGVGYDLVTIDDAAENAFVDAQAAGTRWLGWTDANTPDKYSTEGTFVWQSGAPASYTNWNSGEPNDSSGEDCTEIGDGGGWNDIDCATESRAYVCEQALTTNSTTVAEGGTATLTCAVGGIQAWTSMYGVGAGGSCPASCGSCTIGATSCSVTFNNTNCADCNSGTAKPGELRITCISTPCTNDTLDVGETDVDCGGPDCAGCGDGKSCSVNGDCASGRCTGGGCTSCTDGVKNADETDTDCGGSTCGGCSTGSSCSVSGDCSSGVCTSGTCTPVTYQKALTVQASQVNATLSHFPVLVDLTDAQIGAAARTDGLDIGFYDGGGGLLDFEIELWNSGANHLVAWVRLPSISSSTNTTFYIRYGSGSATDSSNATGVWTSSYLAVFHMDYGGGAGTQLDSTSYGHHVAPPGSDRPSNLAAGKIGAALSFDGDFDRLEQVAADGTGSALDVTTQLSLSGWFYDTTGGVTNVQPYYIVAKRGTDGTDGVHWALLLNKNFRGLDYYYGEIPNPGAAAVTGIDGASFSLGRWVHFTVTIDQPGDLATWYTDGVQRATANDTEGAVTWLTKVNNERLQIGGSPAAADTSFQGYLDELRISAAVRTAAWVSAEFQNQRSGSTFISVGTQQAL